MINNNDEIQYRVDWAKGSLGWNGLAATVLSCILFLCGRTTKRYSVWFQGFFFKGSSKRAETLGFPSHQPSPPNILYHHGNLRYPAEAGRDAQPPENGFLLRAKKWRAPTTLDGRLVLVRGMASQKYYQQHEHHASSVFVFEE